MADALVYYFAYGANMSSEVLTGRRGLCPSRSEAAELPGHRLTFDLPGVPLLEPAFASVIPDPARSVHGVLHALTEPEVRRLDRYESRRYRRSRLKVRGRTVGEVEAEVYVNRRPHEGKLPSQRYLDLLVRGAEEHALPEDYLAFLRSHPRGDWAMLRPVTTVCLDALERLARLR